MEVTAEDYMAEAMAKDMDIWIIYNPRSGPFEAWLYEHLPSKMQSSDGIGWIVVKSPHLAVTQDNPDPFGLMFSWEKLQNSGRPLNLQTITEIAMKHEVKTGKWLFHVDTGIKVDTLWSRVARGIVNGRLTMCRSAKVSPFHAEDTLSHRGNCYRHVICVYNDDFTNEEQVFELENAIRNIGIKCELSYKPDAYTYIGIYRNNKWHLLPTLYKSNYDIITGKSNIFTTEFLRENNTYKKMY